MIPLTNEEKKIHREQNVSCVCEKGFSTDDDNKKYIKSDIIVIILENIEELLMIFLI